jgi:hypothetical protein
MVGARVLGIALIFPLTGEKKLGFHNLTTAAIEASELRSMSRYGCVTGAVSGETGPKVKN